MKLPYFPFFASDWLGSTKIRLMTDAQRGIYITLLAHQWADPSCSIPTDRITLQKLLPGSKWKNIEYVVNECFIKHGDGGERARNPRLNVEQSRAMMKSEKAKASAAHRWHKDRDKDRGENTQGTIEERSRNDRGTIEEDAGIDIASPSIYGPKELKEQESQHANAIRTQCERNAIQNQNQNHIQKEPKIFLSDSVEFGLAQHLLEKIRANKPDIKAPNLNSWAKDIDLMIRIDGRSQERIRAVIDWSQQDTFWNKNILSTGKLRKQFDQLEMKMKGDRDGLQAEGRGGNGSRSGPRSFAEQERQRIQHAKQEARRILGIRGKRP